MKKFLSLLLAAMMLMSMSAFGLAEEEAGFDEYELGVEGEQEVGLMTMAMVYFQPVDMAPAENATPKEGSDLHIEVDLTANENPYGFPVDGWVPYLSIDFSIKDLEGKVFDVSLQDDNLSAFDHDTEKIVTGYVRDSNGIRARIIRDTPPDCPYQNASPTLEEVYMYYFSEADHVF